MSMVCFKVSEGVWLVGGRVCKDGTGVRVGWGGIYEIIGRFEC